MDSEIDLDEEIKKMHIIATAPALYLTLTFSILSENYFSLISKNLLSFFFFF